MHITRFVNGIPVATEIQTSSFRPPRRSPTLNDKYGSTHEEDSVDDPQKA
jgi:hypothetical protein